MTARWYVLTTLLLVAACHQPSNRASLNHATGDSQVNAADASGPMVSRPRAPAGTEQIAATGD